MEAAVEVRLDLQAQVHLGRAHLVVAQVQAHPEVRETLAQQGDFFLMSHMFPVLTSTVHPQLQRRPTEAEDTTEAVRQQPTSLEADRL